MRPLGGGADVPSVLSSNSHRHGSICARLYKFHKFSRRGGTTFASRIARVLSIASRSALRHTCSGPALHLSGTWSREGNRHVASRFAADDLSSLLRVIGCVRQMPPVPPRSSRAFAPRHSSGVLNRDLVFLRFRAEWQSARCVYGAWTAATLRNSSTVVSAIDP